MMTPAAVRSFPADEGGPLADAKECLIDHNLWLESLTVENKGATAVYLQVFNVPRKLAVAVTDTNNTGGDLIAASHGFLTGDRVTFSGIAGLTTHFVNRQDADLLYAYSTRALALAGDVPDVLPTNNGDPGTMTLASDAATAPTYEEYVMLDTTNAPANQTSLTNIRFSRGLYARGVTAARGSTRIASADLIFTPRYLSGPIAGPTSYED